MPDNPISEVNQMLINRMSPFLKVNRMSNSSSKSVAAGIAIITVRELRAGWAAAGIQPADQAGLVRSMIQPMEEALGGHQGPATPACELLVALDGLLTGIYSDMEA